MCSSYPNPGRSARMSGACSPCTLCTLGFQRISSFRFGDFACHLSHPPKYSALLQTCFPLSLVNFYLPFHELLNFLSSNVPSESGSLLCVSNVLVMPLSSWLKYVWLAIFSIPLQRLWTRTLSLNVKGWSFASQTHQFIVHIYMENVPKRNARKITLNQEKQWPWACSLGPNLLPVY